MNRLLFGLSLVLVLALSVAAQDKNKIVSKTRER
jgi:hypothetical protein